MSSLNSYMAPRGGGCPLPVYRRRRQMDSVISGRARFVLFANSPCQFAPGGFSLIPTPHLDFLPRVRGGFACPKCWLVISQPHAIPCASENSSAATAGFPIRKLDMYGQKGKRPVVSYRVFRPRYAPGLKDQGPGIEISNLGRVWGINIP